MKEEEVTIYTKRIHQEREREFSGQGTHYDKENILEVIVH
jgi:hypothetical protein